MHGWSYHRCDTCRVVFGEWPAEFASLDDNSAAINKEMRVAKEVVTRETVWLSGWRLVLRMDNATAVHYVNF